MARTIDVVMEDATEFWNVSSKIVGRTAKGVFRGTCVPFFYISAWSRHDREALEKKHDYYVNVIQWPTGLVVGAGPLLALETEYIPEYVGALLVTNMADYLYNARKRAKER